MATLSCSVAATVVAMETRTIPLQIIRRPMIAAGSLFRLELEQLVRVVANTTPSLLSQIVKSVFRILSQRAVVTNFV